MSDGTGLIKENDLVRATVTTTVAGFYTVTKGQVGTVVSVYLEGKAFAVEFPNQGSPAFVVTLRSDQIELVEPDWKDMVYQFARHVRNTEQLTPLQWGVAGVNLLEKLRELDPETYDNRVK